MEEMPSRKGSIMIGFLKFLLGAAAVVLLAVVVFVGCGTKAMSDYGNSHDMSVDVDIEDIRKISLTESWEQICAGEHHESWDVLCDGSIGFPELDAMSPEEVFDKYRELTTP